MFWSSNPCTQFWYRCRCHKILPEWGARQAIRWEVWKTVHDTKINPTIVFEGDTHWASVHYPIATLQSCAMWPADIHRFDVIHRFDKRILCDNIFVRVELCRNICTSGCLCFLQSFLSWFSSNACKCWFIWWAQWALKKVFHPALEMNDSVPTKTIKSSAGKRIIHSRFFAATNLFVCWLIGRVGEYYQSFRGVYFTIRASTRASTLSNCQSASLADWMQADCSPNSFSNLKTICSWPDDSRWPTMLKWHCRHSHWSMHSTQAQFVVHGQQCWGQHHASRGYRWLSCWTPPLWL